MKEENEHAIERKMHTIECLRRGDFHRDTIVYAHDRMFVLERLCKNRSRFINRLYRPAIEGRSVYLTIRMEKLLLFLVSLVKAKMREFGG